MEPSITIDKTKGLFILTTADWRRTIAFDKKRGLLWTSCKDTARDKELLCQSPYPAFHLFVNEGEFFDGAYELRDAKEIKGAGGGREVQIIFYESQNELEMTFSIETYPDTSVIGQHLEIRNASTRRQTLENVTFVNLSLARAQEFRLYTLRGGVQSRDYPPLSQSINKTSLGDGAVFTIDNGIDSRSSTKYVPWFATLDSEGSGIVGTLEWSGTWEMSFERQAEKLKASGFINRTRFSLAPGASINSGRFYWGIFEGGPQNAYSLMNEFLERRVCLPIPQDFPWPPVCYNNWFCAGSKIDEKLFMKELKAAAELGIEVMVMDASWYEGASLKTDPFTDFSKGLGAWKESRKKFPNGLAAFSNEVHKQGMKFGLWFEPERVDLEMPIAKERRGWLATENGAVKSWGDRVKYGALCFANSETLEWAIGAVSSAIEEYRLDWIKYDMNVFFPYNCDNEKHGHGKHDGLYRHVLGVWNLFEEIHRRFPHLVIENCASGGHRLDAGMFRRSHLSYLNDETVDPRLVRSFITGSGVLLPPQRCYLFAHRPEDVKYGFRSTWGGVPAVSDILHELAKRKRDALKREIALFKEKVRPHLSGIRGLPFGQPRSEQSWDGWTFYNPEKDEGIAVIFRQAGGPEKNLLRWFGVSPDESYIAGLNELDKRLEIRGKELLEKGLTVSIAQPKSSEIIILKRAD